MAGRIVLGIANPALDANGEVDTGATLTFYQNNTTTPQAIYTDATLGVQLSNPLSPDSAGRFPAIWAPDLTLYSVKWTPNGASAITYNDIENTNGTGSYTTVTTEAVKFPATQVPSANANTLDDYEEGTFNPILDTTNVGFSSVTYDALRFGSYTKIGRVVFFNLRMVTDAVTVGSASGDVVIAGLPFTAATGLQAVSVGYASAWAGEEPISAAVLGGTATIAIYYRSAVDGNNTATAVADVATGADANDIVISGFYIV